MACSNHRHVWRCLLPLLIFLAVNSLSRPAAARSSVAISNGSSNRAILQLTAPQAEDATDTITVPRLSLGSIITSIIRWPTSVFSDNSGLPSHSEDDRVLDHEDVFATPSFGSDAARDENSTTDSTSNENVSLQTEPSLSAQMLQPLTDAGFAAINRLLSGNESSDGPYSYDTGLPPLVTMVAVDASHPEMVKSLSADRIQHLGQLQQPLSWVVRSFSVSGDALLKLRLTHSLQLIIREVISSSISDSTAVPEEQVLTFAASNISVALEIQGVDWPSTGVDHGVANGSTPAVEAVRNAMSRIAGGFDPQHISISLEAPAIATSPVPLPAQQQLQPSISHSRGNKQRSVPVYATFYNVDPANTTTLLQALAEGCSPSASGTTDVVESPFPVATAFELGAAVTPSCLHELHREFRRQGISVSDKTFAATVIERPTAAVDLSVAVGLTEAQTRDKLHLRTSEWLNSSALSNIFSEFNLTVVPKDMTEFVLDPETGTFPELSGLNLSSLAAKAVAGSRGAVAAHEESSAQTSEPAAMSKGLIAGICVAAVVSVLAVASMLWLVMRNKRSAAAQAVSASRLPTTSDSDGAEFRRRRRRPRLYQNKYLSTPAAASTASSSVASLPIVQSDILIASQQVKTHLERGDSVSSAVKFEADEQTSEGEPSVPDTAGAAEQQGEDSSSAASSSSSSSTEAEGTSLQQRILEMQEICAQEQHARSRAASAYSMGQDRLNTSGAHHLLSVCTRSVSNSRDLLLNNPSWPSGSPATAVTRQEQQTAQAAGGQTTSAVSMQLASTTTTPPATSVSNAAQLGAVMNAHVAAAPLACSSGGIDAADDAVQPLGASCWHQGGHASGFIVPESVAAYRPMSQPPQGHQQQQSTGGWASPFSFVEQQQRSSSGNGSTLGSSLQQSQRQPRQSTESGSHIAVSPFASEREQQRISACGMGDMTSDVAQHMQQRQGAPQPGTNTGSGASTSSGGMQSSFASATRQHRAEET